MTGVRVPVSLWRSDSRKSSRVRVFKGDLSMRAFSASRCSRVLRMNLEGERFYESMGHCEGHRDRGYAEIWGIIREGVPGR